MILRFLTSFILLASSASAQTGWREWAWAEEQIPYGRPEPHGEESMWFLTNTAGSVIDYYPGTNNPGAGWFQTNIMLRAQDQRAVDCWRALNERWLRLGQTSMTFRLQLYRYDIENIEAIKANIRGMAAFVNAFANPYDSMTYDDGKPQFPRSAIYPMFVDSSMTSNTTEQAGYVQASDTNNLVRWEYDLETTSHYQSRISMSNLYTRANLPCVWSNLPTAQTSAYAEMSVENAVVRPGYDWWGFVRAGAEHSYVGAPADAEDGSGRPYSLSFSWSEGFWFMPETVPFAVDGWSDRTWWYQSPFVTNGYDVAAYGWGRVRDAIRQIHVAAVPYILATQEVTRTGYVVAKWERPTYEFSATDPYNETHVYTDSYYSATDMWLEHSNSCASANIAFAWNESLYDFAIHEFGKISYGAEDRCAYESWGWRYQAYTIPAHWLPSDFEPSINPSVVEKTKETLYDGLVIPAGVIAKFAVLTLDNAQQKTRYNQYGCDPATVTTVTCVIHADGSLLFGSEPLLPAPDAELKDYYIHEFKNYDGRECWWWYDGAYCSVYQSTFQMLYTVRQGLRFMYAVKDLADELEYQ